jgi:hypothetical protein
VAAGGALYSYHAFLMSIVGRDLTSSQAQEDLLEEDIGEFSSSEYFQDRNC